MSASLQGPRGGLQLDGDFDAYENLILLCGVHHKLVDDQSETYTRELLLSMKTNHEAWVQTALDTSNAKAGEAPLLFRVLDGHSLFTLLPGSLGLAYDYDRLGNAQVESLVAVVMDGVKDYLDIWDEMSVSQRIETENEYSKLIKQLEAEGYWLFAATHEGKYAFAGQATRLRVLHLHVIHNTNPAVFKPGATTQLADDIPNAQ